MCLVAVCDGETFKGLKHLLEEGHGSIYLLVGDESLGSRWGVRI